MSNKCYLRIYDSTHLDYLVVAANGATLLSGSAFHADQLPEFPPDLTVWLIVPGTEVLLLQLTLPKMSRHQLEKALPFALEEQLIEEVKNLHFVASKQDTAGQVQVAVVKQPLLQQWLAKCKSLGLYPQAIVPDYLTLPALNDAWHIYLDHDRAVIRQGSLSAMTVEQTQLAEILQLSLQEQQATKPSKIFIDYDDGNEHFDLETLPNLNVPIEMADADNFALQLFAQGLQTPLAIDLLTEEFRINKPRQRQLILWKIAAVLLSCWIIIWLAGNIAQYFVYRARLQQVITQITQSYQQVFSQSIDIATAQTQIAQALLAAENNRSGGLFLNLLAQTGQQITAQKGAVTIQSISFRASTLTLALTADNFQTLANLAILLTQQGLSVQQQNASTQGKTVSANFIIKRNEHE